MFPASTIRNLPCRLNGFALSRMGGARPIKDRTASFIGLTDTF